MRPLSLRLEGLRSYRSPQVVDFEGRTMVAVVGDTGAGKSSLLEAITFALYGSTTWSKQAGDLIGDRVETMKVELTFLADGQRWLATRTMSRGSRASTHRLENLDTGERVDGAREIAVVVERLLGLDHDGFLRTVLLPQGRFAQLLEATPNERQKILRNLFRVDELDRVRDRSRELHTRLEPKLASLRFARGQLADDPRAAAAAAAARADTADVEVKRFDAAATEVDLARRAADDARREARSLDGLLAAVDVPAAEDATHRIGAVAGSDAGLRAAATAAEQALGAADEAVRSAEGELAAATAAGDTEPALRAARAALDALPELAADIAAQVEARTAADAHEVEARAQEAAVTAARAQLEAAEADAAGLDRAIDQARGRLDQLRHRADALAAAEQQLADARTQQAGAVRRRDTATADAERAGAEAAAGREQSRAADARLAEARRGDAAAHAATGLAAGDPCPVCERDLPAGFHAPTVPALAAAEEAAEAARRHAESLAGAASRADAHHEAAVAAVATADELVGAREAAVGTARDALVGEAPSGELPFAVDPAELLAPPTRELADLEGQRAALAARVEGLRADVAASTARAGTLRQQVDAARAGQARAVASCRRRLDQALAALAPVPAWQPELPDLAGALLAADPDAPGSAPVAGPEVDVTAAVGRIDERLTELRELSSAVDARVGQRDPARAALDDARQARRRAAAATAEHYRRLDQLGARVNDAAGRVGAEPTPDPPAERADPDGLAAGATWAEALLARTRTVVAAVTVAAEEHRSAAGQHEAAATTALAQVGVPDADALQVAQAGAIAAAATARDEHDRALADVPQADELDRRIGAAAEFLDAVSLVRDRLAGSAFIGEVMRRRHAELLGVASRILGEVTGERYGFSVDFAIVDLHTGQERPTKTLSGGESFLASLALALAMVEIAARGGGRLDALFLDEGFGSLDRASLDAAIDALESRAKAGRLVAVISHVPGVAERIDDVLQVRATPSGSTAAWQTPADREATFTDDALAAATLG